MNLPESVATLEDIYEAPNSSRLVYLIQDAHTNESGQINLAKTLDIILRHQSTSAPEHQSPYIFVEGGVGDDSLSFLRKYSTLKKRKQVATEYLKKGILHGEEYLDLTSEHRFVIWGVEDIKLYQQAIDAYRAVVKDREKFQDYISRVQGTINTLKSRIFSPDLLAFDEKYAKFLKEETPLTDYFQILIQEAKKRNIPLFSYPHFQSLNNLKEKESNIDFKKANEELQKAIQTLSIDDQQELLEYGKEESPFKLGNDDRRAAKAFYTLVEEKLGARAEQYHQLSKYFSYLKEAKSLNPKLILEEQKSLENEICDILARTSDAQTLLLCQKNLRFLQKLFNLKLTPEEYREYKESSLPIRYLTGYLNKKIMDFQNFYERAAFLEEGYDAIVKNAETFYKLTMDRDQMFIKNMLGKLNDRQAAILITGGFHTTNLKALLKDQNISYVSITPQVYQETNQKRYERLLLHQKISETPIQPGSMVHGARLAAIMNDSENGARLGADLALPKEPSENAERPAVKSAVRLAQEKSGNPLIVWWRQRLLPFARVIWITAMLTAASFVPNLKAQLSSTSSLLLPDLFIAPGTDVTIEVPVILKVGTTPVTALQFDVTLPAGLSYVSGTVRSAASEKSYYSSYGLIGANVLRVLLVGFTNKTMTSGEVVRLTLHATPAISGTAYRLPMSGILLSSFMMFGDTSTNVSEVNTAPPSAPTSTSALIINSPTTGSTVNSSTVNVLYSYTSPAQSNNDPDTKLLLRFDGTNGSNVFTDSSASAHPVTANGNAHISTEPSPFGGTSAAFDGLGDYLSMPNSSDFDFGSGDFTLEFQVKYNSVTDHDFLNAYAGGGVGWALIQQSSTGRGLNLVPSSYTNSGVSVAWTPSANIWYHIACVRSGNNVMFFVNGIQQGATKNVTGMLFNTSGGSPHIAEGLFAGTGGLNGSIGWLRVSKGIARWTSNFTPPAPDPNAADHVQFQLDSNPAVIEKPMDGVYSFTGVPAGSHTVNAFLVNSANSKIPGTDASVSFTSAFVGALNVMSTDTLPMNASLSRNAFADAGVSLNNFNPILAAPSNITADATSRTNVSLSWNDTPGAVGFILYRNDSYLKMVSKTNVNGAIPYKSVIEFIDDTVSEGTIYTYFVQSYDASGNISAPSPAVTVTTPPGARLARSVNEPPTERVFKHLTPADQMAFDFFAIGLFRANGVKARQNSFTVLGIPGSLRLEEKGPSLLVKVGGRIVRTIDISLPRKYGKLTVQEKKELSATGLMAAYKLIRMEAESGYPAQNLQYSLGHVFSLSSLGVDLNNKARFMDDQIRTKLAIRLAQLIELKTSHTAFAKDRFFLTSEGLSEAQKEVVDDVLKGLPSFIQFTAPPNDGSMLIRYYGVNEFSPADEARDSRSLYIPIQGADEVSAAVTVPVLVAHNMAAELQNGKLFDAKNQKLKLAEINAETFSNGTRTQYALHTQTREFPNTQYARKIFSRTAAVNVLVLYSIQLPRIAGITDEDLMGMARRLLQAVRAA